MCISVHSSRGVCGRTSAGLWALLFLVSGLSLVDGSLGLTTMSGLYAAIETLSSVITPPMIPSCSSCNLMRTLLLCVCRPCFACVLLVFLAWLMDVFLSCVKSRLYSFFCKAFENRNSKKINYCKS